MKELVETLVKALVKNPDAVSITVVEKGSLEIYQVHVAPEDMGKVIGRKGRIANAIRTVVKAGRNADSCSGSCEIQAHRDIKDHAAQ